MKVLKPLSILAAAALVVPLALSLDATTPAAQRDHVARVTRVDDPPPDPTDCPFCGGNPELHRQRMQALLRLTAVLFERAVP